MPCVLANAAVAAQGEHLRRGAGRVMVNHGR